MNEPPTIYKTLMEEAVKDASSGGCATTGSRGLDQLLSRHVSEASVQIITDEVRYAVREAYIRGVTHGYVQAAQKMDGAK